MIATILAESAPYELPMFILAGGLSIAAIIWAISKLN